MDIIETINTINETYEELYEEYGCSYMYRSAELNFTNGYCYDFYCLLRRFFPAAELVMKNDKMHCAALIDGEVYDATGLRDDKKDFHIATGCDMEYIYKYYGFLNASMKQELNRLAVRKVFEKKKVSVKTLNKIT